MIKLIARALFVFSIGCASENTGVSEGAPLEEAKVLNTDSAPKIDDSFDVSFVISQIDGDLYKFTVGIELRDGSYVVSPFSEDTVYGHLDISIGDNEYVSIDNLLNEIPASFQEYDSVLERTVQFVRDDTGYEQELEVLMDMDFEVSGMVWFVLEPSCVPYEVEFIISSKDGEISVEKTKTTMALGC